MKTMKEQENAHFFKMICKNRYGTHGLTYELAHLLRHIEHEGIRQKMIDLNNEYNEWIDKVMEEHYKTIYK